MILNYKTFATLAKGYMTEYNYRNELYKVIHRAAKKHNIETDFIGLPNGSSPAADAIYEVLKDFDQYETFPYFYCDCEGSYEKFNSRTSWTDPKTGEKIYPDCHNLLDLWKFIMWDNNYESKSDITPPTKRNVIK